MEPNAHLCPACQEVVNKQPELDIVAFIHQLEEYEPLQPREKEYLCLSLSGYSPYQIAFRRHYRRNPKTSEDWDDKTIEKKERNLKGDMSKLLYPRIRNALCLDEAQQFPPWSHIVEMIKEAGFEEQPCSAPTQTLLPPSSDQTTFFLAIQSAEGTVLDKNKVEKMIQALQQRYSKVELVTIIQSLENQSESSAHVTSKQ